MAVSKQADSFIHELKLKTTPYDVKVLEKRLEAARQLYNACLGEGLKRLVLVRQSKCYQKALQLPAKVQNTKKQPIANKERAALFKQANTQHQFSDYALQNYVLWLRKGNDFGSHIDSLSAQKLAKRAYDAVYQHAIGLRGRPRFKGKHRLCSVEGKNNASGIRWKDQSVHWSGLQLTPRFDLKDKHGLEAYALSCQTKYVRLVRRTIKGQVVWYAQLIQTGKPFAKAKNPVGIDIVGLDIGPSTIAMVNQSKASLQAFCDEVESYDKGIKALQRKVNRSMRSTNPENYEANRIIENSNGKKRTKLGKSKKGATHWCYSNHCKTRKSQVREAQRKMASARNTAQGQLANQVIALGKTIKTEKLSYKGFQKLFGKSVGRRSPATFLSKLRYKAENAGGAVIEFNTYHTALSQTCVCGHKQKKPLKQRWHHCDHCGATAQRDLFSANLARYVHENSLDTHQAKAAWSGVDTLLAQTVSKLNETAKGQSKRLSSFGLSQRQSGSSVQEKSTIDKALDGVGNCREPKSVNSLVLRTPWL